MDICKPQVARQRPNKCPRASFDAQPNSDHAKTNEPKFTGTYARPKRQGQRTKASAVPGLQPVVSKAGSSWLLFNVGGVYFQTTRSTITKATTFVSPLFRAAANSTQVQWDRDERGAYLIDRDPMRFRVLLNFFRDSQLTLNHEVTEEALLFEASYFCLPELTELLKERIHERQSQWALRQTSLSLCEPPLGWRQ